MSNEGSYLLTNCASAFRPLSESPRHFSQKRSSSVFKTAGGLPASEALTCDQALLFLQRNSREKRDSGKRSRFPPPTANQNLPEVTPAFSGNCEAGAKRGK